MQQPTQNIASAAKDTAAVVLASATGLWGIPLATINQVIQIIGGVLAILFTLYRFWVVSRRPTQKIED